MRFTIPDRTFADNPGKDDFPVTIRQMTETVKLSLLSGSTVRGAISGVLEGGFYFHPSDKDLSPGTPKRKKPLTAFSILLFTETWMPSGFFLKKKPP